MNALNLKITGDTKKKGKKKEMPEDVSVFYEMHGSCKAILDLLSKAPSLEAQIACLKSNLHLVENVQNDHEVVDLLLDMIFLMNTKCPLRTAILKQLSVREGIRGFIIQDRLVRFIKANTSGSDMESVGRLLNFLPAWLENSSGSCHLPNEIIGDCVVPYLKRTLVKFQADLSAEMPPTSKLQVLEILHSNVRCLLTIFQKFSTCPSSDLLDLMVAFLRNDQLPLDTRANCGILFALGFKAVSEDTLGNVLIDTVNEELDPLAMLCLCGGFLNVLESDSLLASVSFNGENVSLLQYLLQKIISCEESNPADCTIVLSSSRCLLVGTKCLVGSPDLLSKAMLPSLLNYIWIHLEHYMDAVRHLASSSLTNIVVAGKKMTDSYVFEIITHDIETMASDRRSKHAAISALIGNLPIQSLLDKSPDLVATLLESAKSSPSANHAICSFESLMIQHYQEKESFEQWFCLWVDPVIRIFGNRPNAALEHILNAVMKLNPDVVRRISEIDKSDGLDLTSILLICLRIAKKLGIIKLDQNEGNLSELMDYKMLAKNVYHLNGDVRIACFALITETQKLSEEFTAEELEVVKLFLKYNVSNHCASERQKTLAYFKKFIARLKLLLDQCGKQMSKQQKADIARRFELHSNFVSWLRQFCVDSLFPGANFARRCTALNMLTLCREFGLWDGFGQSEENCAVLMLCLLDSYEENKILAKKLLVQVPVETLKFNDSDYLKRYLHSAVRLASSVRPIDSQSAAYFVGLLAAFPSAARLLWLAYQQEIDVLKTVNIDSIPDPSRYICCTVVLAELKCELSIAKRSLLKAASSGPLYGQLFVLRNVIKEAILSELVNSQEWRCLIQDIITIAYDCNNTVACIVNSSSPEGHLPMDFDYDVDELRENEDCPKVTAQMVLLSSWRTVKEVSLLLGEISESVPISTQDDPGLISEQQVLEIGEHLSNLLAETKHRGAFEQAYVGFCKLASRLWRYPKGNLHELPGRWLAETLDEISNNQKLSATRRSAGIPFRIQGLVCTELEVGRGKCFHRGIKTLLELAGNPMNPVETKCHALNILRALYRHTLLGEMVSPYVADGLSIAIEGFNASTWAERNSSTLLMSALMTRIFGVPRSRSENLCWKNKMTGRIFFQRYPSLFGILLRHLELASQKSLYPATYPALLVLGRLYPSSLEGTDTNLQLNKFIPLVHKCSGSNILKTRSLAASAMVALITPNLFVDHIEGIFKTVGVFNCENFTHGLLLQVLELFRSSDILPEDVTISLNQKLPTWTDRLVNLLRSEHSFVTKTACVSILLHWVTHFFNNLKSLHELANLLIDEIENNDGRDIHFGASTFALYSATLVLTINNYQRKDKETVECVKIFLNHPNYDVRNITLDFVRSVLSTECQNGIKNAFLQSTELAEIVLDRYEGHSHHEDHVELLNVMSHLPAVFQILDERKISVVEYFGRTIDSKPESLGSLAFKCISSCTKFKKLNLQPPECTQLCRIIDMYSLPSCENSCRSFVAEFLRTNFDWLLKICTAHDRLIVWTSALRLLNDDDGDIRELLSSAFSLDVIPYVALERFFDKLATDELEPGVKWCLLLGWSLWNCSLEDLDGEDGSDCVFEKGDMNTYLEEMTINLLACRHLKSLGANHPEVFALQLPDYCFSWLLSFTNLPLFHSKNREEFVGEFQSQIARHCSTVLSQSPFRHNELSLSLLSRKLDNVWNSLTF